MFRRKRRGTFKTYQVAITIIEAKHLAQNANPMVVVKVGNQKKKTIVRNNTDSPYYNEYFVFNFTGDFNLFLSTKISILVYLKHYLRLKFYGGISLEVATVWEEPGHEYYHKWAILTNPKDRPGGIKGYVKCNISIIEKGEIIRIQPETEAQDDIEENLLMPVLSYPLSGRQRAQYIFCIYRADGLPYADSNLCCGSSKKPINPFIQISFAGLKGETSWCRRTYHARFNERIVFSEMFPPLSYRIRIAIKDKVNSCHSSTLATHTINLSDLLNYAQYGYLPTFGPSFIHFYQGNNSNCKCCCPVKCQSIQPIYRGRTLLSLKTEIDDSGSFIAPRVDIEPTAPIIEKNLWTIEEYLLVSIVYDVCMIDRCGFTMKSISFEITFGNIGSGIFPNNIENIINQTDEVVLDNRPDFESHTVPRLTTATDGKFNHLPLGSNKPCMYIKSWWPNFEWRISNSNCLLYIANFLENNLAKLETLIAIKSRIVYENYNSIIRSLKHHCMHYLHILDTKQYDVNGGTTKLDRHRINFCRECIDDIIKMINLNGQLSNNNYIKIAMIYAYKYAQKIRKICEDPQHAFPDVFIWMIAGTRRVALARLAVSDIIYSEMELSRGTKCGQRINLFMKNIDDNYSVTSESNVCNIEIFLWFGNTKFSSACWNFIPSGYQVEHTISIDSFPRSFHYTHSLKFQLRAHIFQGRFDCGLDSTGLMDSFIRIIFKGYTATTKPIRQSLAPVWDQTLVLPPVNLYGSKENIKLLPPSVIIEVFDWDFCGMKEFYGRCVAEPVVKLAEEAYSSPEFPPILMWYTLTTQTNFEGSILAAFELIELTDDVIDYSPILLNEKIIYNLPNDIRPVMKSHRLEIVFWGVRDMKKINGIHINKPRVIVECCGVHVNSEIMKSAKKFSNFRENHVIINLDLPQQFIYYPPLTVRIYDSRVFGRFTYVGVCIIPNSHIFLEELLTEEEYNREMNVGSKMDQIHQIFHQRQNSSVILPLPIDYSDNEKDKRLINYKKLNDKRSWNRISKMFSFVKILLRNNKGYQKYKQDYYGNDESESNDWWSKYYASVEEEKNNVFEVEKKYLPGQKAIATFKIYQSELEMQPEFNKFQDKLTTFELSRGKADGYSDSYENNYTGKFKGHISIYPWPHPQQLACKTKSGKNLTNGLLLDYPPQEFVKLLIRIYIVKGINLHPCDPFSGKSDPYLVIKLGKSYINDRKNYILNQSNPIFGKSFEMEAYLPRDHTLIIQVWDHDTTSADDMIGETKIDIENRYYSDHRGQCGISKTYNTFGYNSWRDFERPTQILQSLCIKNNLPMPEFSLSCVTIGKQKFPFHPTLEGKNRSEYEECMALNVLHQWQIYPVCGTALVPEHIERRSLFNAKKPGFEQGKLELWVDMFRVDELPPKPLVNITPQVPEDYELRIIIWNTEDVPLIDNQFLTSEKCSDIYVKCWISYEDCQKTDVHYNSLTGEGNFNWRFIFRFTYTESEHLMIIRRKISAFSLDETEEKLPCKLNIQVWDSDHFSPDDFLGSLTMDLSRMPRGSANSKNCTLKVIHPNSPMVNLFAAKRMKAWWPFSRVRNNGEHFQAGKVEMELTLVPKEEAEKMPVGKGRNPPNPLPPPNRPDTSFSWFRNPWKACCFVVCRYYRGHIICFCIILFLIFFFACAIYAFPGYLVKKLLRA